MSQYVSSSASSQLFLQRERAAVLAEAQTDDLIKEAPKPALDQSGEWQETGGEIQWVANDNNDANRQDDAKKKQKDEEDEELDLNKGSGGGGGGGGRSLRRNVTSSWSSTPSVFCFQLCSTPGSTWRTALWPRTRRCCWAACVRGAR